MAAVDKIKDQCKPEDFIGHRNIARQVLSAQMSLTSVFGMAASPSTACGGVSEGVACAAVGRMQACLPGAASAGHRNRKQVEPVPNEKIKASTFLWRLVFALPIFPGSRPPSIVGTNELNFCVRDGNRWTLIVINTNYSFIRIW